MQTLCHACLWSSLLGLALGAAPKGMAKITVTSPASLKGAYRGYFAASSLLPAPEGSATAVTPIGDASGCSAFEIPQADLAMVMLPAGGNCSLMDKVANAKGAGAKILMVIAEADAINITGLDENTTTGDDENLGIFVFELMHTLGSKFLDYSSTHADDPVHATVEVYKGTFPLVDPSVLCLVALAVALVGLGAWFNTAAQRADSPLAPESAEQILKIEWWLPIGWMIGASTALVVLYFTMKYLIYVVLAVFGLGGAGCITEIGHAVLKYNWPAMGKQFGCGCDAALLLSFVVGMTNSALWFFLRHGPHAWPFQNIIGICFLCFFQRSIHLPNIKLAAMLLTLMFLFDIFWVFLSPFFFSQSVMVAVAMGGGSGEVAPMMLRIPAFNDPLGTDRMLGYGDIAIPGLMVSMLRRYDILHYKKWNTGYFWPAMVGYGVGLCSALVGLYLMQMGQPALLYLVPGTLGTTLVLACKRGEMKALWNWDGAPDAENTLLASARFCPKGFALQSVQAPRPGNCDGCGIRIAQGQRIMYAAISNYYLCTSCRPQTEEEADGGSNWRNNWS